MENGIAVDKPKNEVAVIFDRITSGLQAFEEKKESLLALVAETKDLTVSDINDRPTIVKVIEGRKKLKKERVSIEKDGKALREPLTAVNRQISAKEAELVAITDPEEKRLEGIEEWVDSERERVKQEEIAAAKARIQSRIDKLAAYGQTIDIAYIESASDETFERVLERAKIEHEKELAEQEAERKREQERQEQAEKDRKELQLLREKQAEADRIIRERQEEADRIEREAKEKEEQAAAIEIEKAEAKQREKIDSRIKQMTEFGLRFNFNTNQYEGFDCWVHSLDIIGWDDEKWEKMISEMGPHIEAFKKDEADKAEEKRQADLKDAAEKALAEQKEREAEAARQEAERLAQASDKEKYEQVIKHLKDFPKVEMKSPAYKKKLAIIKDFIADL